MTTVKAISPMDMVYSPVQVKVYQQLTEPDMIALVAQSAVQEYAVLCCSFEPQQTLYFSSQNPQHIGIALRQDQLDKPPDFLLVFECHRQRRMPAGLNTPPVCRL